MNLVKLVVKGWNAGVAVLKKGMNAAVAAFDKGANAVGAAFDKGVNAVSAFAKSAVEAFAPVKRVAFAIATLFVGVVAASAQSSGGTTFADPSTITSTATTVFTAVATLMVGIVGFWVVLKIVRKISGK